MKSFDKGRIGNKMDITKKPRGTKSRIFGKMEKL